MLEITFSSHWVHIALHNCQIIVIHLVAMCILAQNDPLYAWNHCWQLKMAPKVPIYAHKMISFLV